LCPWPHFELRSSRKHSRFSLCLMKTHKHVIPLYSARKGGQQYTMKRNESCCHRLTTGFPLFLSPFKSLGYTHWFCDCNCAHWSLLHNNRQEIRRDIHVFCWRRGVKKTVGRKLHQ
jgi:hypothetical protein